MSRIVKQKYEMPLQPVEERIRNFEEVALGYDEETAIAETKRCLECKKPKCVEGCPVEVPIPQFISLIKKGDFEGAISVIKSKNSLFFKYSWRKFKRHIFCSRTEKRNACAP